MLGKMGEHRQALEIYVFKLGNPEKAEEYGLVQHGCVVINPANGHVQLLQPDLHERDITNIIPYTIAPKVDNQFRRWSTFHLPLTSLPILIPVSAQ